LKQHEDICEYAPVACPNSGSELCGFHRRKSLQKHIDSCLHVPCPNHSKGARLISYVDCVVVLQQWLVQAIMCTG